MLRSFFSSFWKTIVALIVLVALAVVTMNPSSARPALGWALSGLATISAAPPPSAHA